MDLRVISSSARLSSRVSFLAALLLLPVICMSGCKKEEPKKFSKSGPKVEVKADGLTYEVGTAKPFTGAVRSYVPKSDILLKETLYTDGKLDGYARRWFPENPSQLSDQRLWVRGDPVFSWRWWPNGNLRELSSQRNALKDRGRPDIAFGSYVKWFQDGKFKFKAHYNDKFQWHGHVIDYDDEGKLMWDAEFEHGVFISGHRPPDEPAPPAR